MIAEEHSEHAYATAEAIREYASQFDHSKHCHSNGTASCLAGFAAAAALYDPETEMIGAFVIGDDAYWIDARATEALGFTEEQAHEAFKNPVRLAFPDGSLKIFDPTAADAENAMLHYAATGKWDWLPETDT